MDKKLRVGGFTPFTAIDFPGALSAVVFCQGCPWRCRYCHNGEQTESKYDWQQLLQHLQTRRGLLDAVVFSGGEPTAQSALETAINGVLALGFKVGLHTAGMYPRRIAHLLPLLDWASLDIKVLPENYDAITRVPNSGAAPWQSAAILTTPLQVRLTPTPR
ncbi:anaerobic ribonucleoside-triphosphate reductase activating protein [Microbulbifer sp. TRSA002]|uniref:anaerobic ribonucleoside-triphosphate reductase activating protein n=1 Tax=Microbulbifer sp. TRSA002 TaxID=3243382 RepID=UPI00403A3061